MGVLQDFERRLEGAVEGFFARAFGSGLQAIELAKGLRRYAMDTRHVTEDGVVVPNVYRVRVSTKDAERFDALGIELADELAQVVAGSASEEGWILRGPAAVIVEPSEDVRLGRYEVAGRVEGTRRTPAAPPPAGPSAGPSSGPSDGPPDAGRQSPEDPDAAPAGPDPDRTPDSDVAPAEAAAAPAASTPRDHTMVLRPDGSAATSEPPPSGATLRVISGGPPALLKLEQRIVAGRGADVALRLEDDTVSREHAAFVRRESEWWVVDLGSTNGTTVNGRKAAEHQLSDGDRVGLGEAVLEFVEV